MTEETFYYLEVILNCYQDIPDSVRVLIPVQEPAFVSTFYTFYRFNVPIQQKQQVEAALNLAQETHDVLSFRFTAAPLIEHKPE